MTLDDILKGNIFTGDLELIHFLDITEETENNSDKEQYFLKVLETVYKESKDFKLWEFLNTFNSRKLGCVIWNDDRDIRDGIKFEFNIDDYIFNYDKEMNPLICSDLAIFLGLVFLYQYLNVSKVVMDIFNKPGQFADYINGLHLDEEEEDLLMELLLGDIFGTHYYDFYLDDKILHPSYAKILNIYNTLDGIVYRLSDYEFKPCFNTNESLRKNFCILRSDIIRYIKKALQIQEVK